MYSMPSNEIELWAALESDRMMHPVMREFYKERSVVMEERRMRTDSSPTGRLVEQFLGTAFMANPYHRPTIGYASDLESFSATDAAEFFQRLLRAQQHGDRTGGRPRSRKGLSHHRRIFRPPAHDSQAGGAVHRRAAAEFSASSYAAGPVAAVLPRGLSPAQLPGSGRCGVRRDQRHPVQRPHFAPVSVRWCATRRLPPLPPASPGFRA